MLEAETDNLLFLLRWALPRGLPTWGMGKRVGEFRVPRCRKWGLVETIAQSTFSPQSGHIPSLSHLPTPSPHPALPHSRSSNTGVHGCGGGERHCLATLGIHRLREAITHLSEVSGGGTRIAPTPTPGFHKLGKVGTAREAWVGWFRKFRWFRSWKRGEPVGMSRAGGRQSRRR